MPLAPGTKLGPYQVLAPIGAGGMGEVFLARDTRLARDVAIKVLPDAVASDSKALARFEREARAVAALSHPNILSIFDVGETDGIHFAVTELLVGEPLRALVARGPVPVMRSLEIAEQIAQALAAAHKKGIVHRDIKPENVFLTKDGYTKLLDFGLARFEPPLPSSEETHSPTLPAHTEVGTVVGTIGYMSPEQVRGQTVDHRTDIFSLGCLLYEMLSGERAFRGDTPADTLSSILSRDPPPLSGSGREIPPALQGIVSGCLEKRPGDRFSSAYDLALALRSCSGGPEAIFPTLALPQRRSPRWLLGAATVGLLGAAVGLLAWAPWRRPAVLKPASFGPVEVVKLTWSGNVGEAAISPDGTFVSFTRLERGDESLWLRTVATEEETRIGPAGEGGYRELLFESDGTHVLFMRPDPAPDGLLNLWSIPVFGGRPRKVVENVDSRPVLFPDGKTIGFSRRSADRVDQLVCALDGPAPRVVWSWPASTQRVWGLALSEDGRRLAALRGDGNGQRQLVIVEAADGKVLTSRLSHALEILWTRNAALVIATWSLKRPWRFLEVVDPDNLGLTQPLLDDGGSSYSMTATRDGRILATVQQQGTGGVWLIPIAGQQTPLTTPGIGRQEGIGVTPLADGRVLYWALDRQLSLWVSGDGTREPTRLLREEPAGPILSPVSRSLSPDGRTLLLIQPTSGRPLTVGLAGGDISSSFKAPPGVRPVEALYVPGGDIYFDTRAPSGEGEGVSYRTGALWRVPQGPPGEAAVMVRDGCQAPRLSPDGRRLALVCGNGEATRKLVVLSLPGEAVASEAPWPPGIDLERSRWTPDGAVLAGVDEKGSIVGIDPRTGLTQVLLASEESPVWMFAFSPDGRQLAAIRGDGEIWLRPRPGAKLERLTAWTPDKAMEFAWSPDSKSLVASRIRKTRDIVLLRRRETARAP